MAAALAPISGSVLAAPKFEAGKEYLTVMPPAAASGDQIEVVEFFAYTCPHCLQFQPIFDKWRRSAPSDVAVRVCPVAWQPKFLPFTQTYFALEAMGLLDTISLPFFESVIYQEHPYSAEDPAKDIFDFMKSKNVDVKKFEQTYRSFGVMNKSRIATQLWQNYQIDSTPMIGVGGLYTTGPHLVGSREKTPECIDFLVDLVRAGRRR